MIDNHISFCYSIASDNVSVSHNVWGDALETVERGETYCTDGQYGIRLYLSDGRVLLRDAVDTSAVSVRRLLCRLQGQETDAEQLEYLIEDHLVREYTVRT